MRNVVKMSPLSAIGLVPGAARPDGGRRFALQDGKRMIVGRLVDPAKVEVAIRIAQEAVRQNDAARLQNLPAEVGCDYKFVGWLAEGGDGVLLDEDGKVIGTMQQGDSMFTERT